MLQFEATTEEDAAANTLAWGGLLEVLKNSCTLETLFVSDRHVEQQDESSTIHWNLLRQGVAQNTSLVSLTIETTNWNEDKKTALREMVCRHPRLATSDVVRDERNPCLIKLVQAGEASSTSDARQLVPSAARRINFM